MMSIREFAQEMDVSEFHVFLTAYALYYGTVDRQRISDDFAAYMWDKNDTPHYVTSFLRNNVLEA
jgi:predicted DNA-binding transcriptional regulator